MRKKENRLPPSYRDGNTKIPFSFLYFSFFLLRPPPSPLVTPLHLFPKERLHPFPFLSSELWKFFPFRQPSFPFFGTSSICRFTRDTGKFDDPCYESLCNHDSFWGDTWVWYGRVNILTLSYLSRGKNVAFGGEEGFLDGEVGNLIETILSPSLYRQHVRESVCIYMWNKELRITRKGVGKEHCVYKG